ncbi:MAG: HAMP domain-containing sensor histidine kinase, partial [Acidimicrobiales bacterium]
LSEMGGFRRLVLAVGLGSMLAFVARGREFSRRALVGTAFLAVLIVLIPVLGNLAFVVGYVLAGSWLIRTGLDSDRPAVWSAGLLLFAVVLGDVVAMGAELASPRSVEATLIVFLGVLAAVGGASTELRRGFLAQSSLVDELQLATALHGARAAELGHEQRSALVAIEGALTKLRVDGSSLTAIDFSRLTNAAASEIERLRRMVGTASEPSVVGRIGIGELLRPYLACQQARGVAILVDIDPDVEVVVKHDEFTRIVQNLVENAHHHGDAPTIEVSASCQRGEVTVIVADNGPGIPQALFDVIFDAGVSSDPINRSGLGLSICRRILTDMQGTIDVSDRVGGGCVFTIRLPEAGHSSASQDLPAPIWAAKAAG